MKPLQPPDTFHLNAAQGWLELGDHVSASDELEEITPQLRAHPDVLLVRCEIYHQIGKWDALLAVAESLVKIVPKNPQAWIHRSFALHEMKRTQEAFDLLQPAAAQFPKLWVIPYNLACYTAQLAQIQEVKNWFKKAMALNEVEVKRIALDDPDLVPLWEGMQGSSWKRTC